VRREQHWIAALAIGQFGLAIAVFGMALVRGDSGTSLTSANGWPSVPLSGICVLAGAMLIGAAAGALAVAKVQGAAAAMNGQASEGAVALRAAGLYRLTEDAEVTQLADMPGGDPFRELLRPSVQIDAVRAAAFSTRDGLTLSARLPHGLDVDRLSAMAPTLLAAAPEWLPNGDGLGAEGDVSIRKRGHSLVVLARDQILLSAMLDETAEGSGAARAWLEATAAAGAMLWRARYGTSNQRSATLS
jgi:predicted regulator of Ras-like GTPase activity (Roadblock/LC7/MglB family)